MIVGLEDGTIQMLESENWFMLWPVQREETIVSVDYGKLQVGETQPKGRVIKKTI